jgi:methionyl-tRNA synthetase
MTEADIYGTWAQTFGLSVGIFMLVMFLVIIWNMVWKGIALYKAGKNQHLGWFIVLFLINTMGLLEIIYIFAVKGQKNNNPAPAAPNVQTPAQTEPPQQPPVQTPPPVPPQQPQQ